MKYLLTTLFMFSLMTLGYGQKGKVKQQIEAARIALITQRLDLSPAEAEKFWPIYNEFTLQRRALRSTLKEERSKINTDSLSEDQRKEILQKGIDLKQKELDLEKEYSQKILNVISTEQMMSLRTAERDFKRMLLKRVQQSKQNQQLRKRKNN